MGASNEEGTSSADIKPLEVLLRRDDLKVVKAHVTATLKLPASDDEFALTYNEGFIRDFLSQVTKNDKSYDVREALNIGVK